MGFNISKKLVESNTDGTVNLQTVKGKDGKDIKLAKVYLPSSVNFEGLEDISGVEVFGVASAYFYITPNRIMEDKYNDQKFFIKVDEKYIFPVIHIDLGKTGRLLENGKNEHNFTKLINVPSGKVENAMKHWITFTISKAMKGTTYTNARDEERCQVFIPEGRGKYGGYRFTIDPKNLKEIKGHDNLLQVVIHRDAEFTVTKSNVLSANISTGEKEYETFTSPEKLKSEELAKYFAYPTKESQTALEEKEDKEIENEEVSY